MGGVLEIESIKGPAGLLDGRLHGPRGGRPVVLLHPHPRHGGTMGSRLVYDLALALSGAGFRVLRFDFRGVGRSEGVYANGTGEVQDAVAAWDHLHEATGRPPAVVGFSFGAAVGVALATKRPVPRLVCIGLPAQLTDSALHPADDAPDVACPTTLIVGTADPFTDPDQARQLAQRLGGSHRVVVLEGAGHFLEPSHNPRAVAAVLEELATQP